LTDAENMLGVNGSLTTTNGAVQPPSVQAPATTSVPTTQTSGLHYNHILASNPT
jgi:hypothetical protein